MMDWCVESGERIPLDEISWDQMLVNSEGEAWDYAKRMRAMGHIVNSIRRNGELVFDRAQIAELLKST